MRAEIFLMEIKFDGSPMEGIGSWFVGSQGNHHLEISKIDPSEMGGRNEMENVK